MNYKWKIFLADLNPVTGSEQKGKRPVLIVSDDDYSSLMPLVTILPVTSLKPGREIYPNEVLVEKQFKGESGLIKDSVVLAHQIRTISKKRLINKLGTINNTALKQNIDEALRIHLNL
ncbi:MAG: type II toxin-antitoxin system PemK/MazF family toxin [Actinobacteria bacterium]|nr:type II toxin-antitoxin system PemK/MazF family toxin [Actinomycetota bacterium]